MCSRIGSCWFVNSHHIIASLSAACLLRCLVCAWNGYRASPILTLTVVAVYARTRLESSTKVRLFLGVIVCAVCVWAQGVNGNEHVCVRMFLLSTNNVLPTLQTPQFCLCVCVCVSVYAYSSPIVLQSSSTLITTLVLDCTTRKYFVFT